MDNAKIYPSYEQQLALKRTKTHSWDKRKGLGQALMILELTNIDLRNVSSMFYKCANITLEGVIIVENLAPEHATPGHEKDVYVFANLFHHVNTSREIKVRIRYIVNNQGLFFAQGNPNVYPVKGQPGYFQAQVELDNQVYRLDNNPETFSTSKLINLFSAGAGSKLYVTKAILGDEAKVASDYIW